jgi:serine/arginine repetitive matrix protein 2
VPKKSKLGLLGVSAKKSQTDFSDVVRRVGGTTSAGRGAYEIHVDHTEDLELEEVVLVKKKKSRLGLDGIFGDENILKSKSSGNALKPKSSANILRSKGSSNILKAKTKGAENSLKPKGVENLLKPKAEEKDKWWSISRGRKDSSKEQKDSKRSKCDCFPS